MFFIFHFLVLINYVSYSYNFVLNRTIKDLDGNITQNVTTAVLLDKDTNIRNISLLTSKDSSSGIVDNNLRKVRSPNFKVNLFDNRLSNEMLSIKQTVHGRDITRTVTELKNTKNNIGTPTLEVNQKWPAVELLYKLDETEENGENSNDFDFRQLFSEDSSPKSENTDNVLNNQSNRVLEEQQSHSKDKVVDMRSLTGHGPPKPSDLQQRAPGHNCSCSRGTIHSQAPAIGGFPYPTGGPFPNNWGSFTSNGMLSYTLLPFYLPYEPYFHDPANIYKEYSKPTADEVFYYNEDNKIKDDGYIDNDDHEKKIKTTTKRRKTKKTTKFRDDDNTIIFNIDYDLIPRDTTVKRLTTQVENNARTLENGIKNDFKFFCPCSIYSGYCCSSSSLCNRGVKLHIIFLLLFLVGNNLFV